MFARVTIRVADVGAARRFYETVLPQGHGELEIAAADEAHPVTTRLHVGFPAASHDEVAAFHERGMAAGYRSDGEPGPRAQYAADYYGAFLLDPDGNSVEAMRYTPMRPAGIDHIWIRVADIESSTEFHVRLAKSAGLQVGTGDGGHMHVRDGAGASYALVPADPSWPVTTPFELELFAGAGGFDAVDPDGHRWRTVEGAG